jgi:Holliday junction resolvasome RuvABC endonuclease subunit
LANNLPQFFSGGAHRLLILDPSSDHLAYAIIILDFNNKEMFVENCGMVWSVSSWSKGKKYRYMFNVMRLFAQGILDQVPEAFVTEAFFSNPKAMMGSPVIPTINAFALMAADEFNMSYFDMGATTWRGILGIKATKDSSGKRDYKVPTANLVSQFIKLPDQIQSNINRKMRKMPNDITDVLAIAIATGRHHGINKVVVGNAAFMPFQWLEKLEKLAKEI